MSALLIILIIVLIIIVFILSNKLLHFQHENKDILNEVQKELSILENDKQQLLQDKNLINTQIQALQNVSKITQESIDEKNRNLQELTANIETSLNSAKAMSETAFANFVDCLENKYEEEKEEYDELINSLKKAYENQQLSLLKEREEILVDLEKIRATRNAAVQATVREQEIKEQLAFYCLPLSDTDAADIQILNSIKPKLGKPRILSMLIWSTFFQKPMTTLCNNIVGTTVKTGIYKITNQKTNLCYIGQAVDIADRWKTHAKCGLGIDTPINNKLYKAMIEDGIENFSWEILEECQKSDLDQKEKFYIELYDSKNFGYNTTSGNK